MSTSELPSDGASSTAASSDAASSASVLLATFIAAIFVSAALLFAVQPMFTKMVLPRLGGAASVWSVAMVFFQTTLLAGYAYAHLLTRFAPGRTSVIIHLGVMVVACFALPLHIATGWGRPPPVGEAFWLLGLFAVSIGLPFFALAANGPLLQAWFVRTGHPAAKDPYFLYAASNAGSFLALISYPVVVEPFVRLGDQTLAWTIGFYVLILLIGSLRRADAAVAQSSPGRGRGRRRERGRAEHGAISRCWVALAAVPSGLLIAVTAPHLDRRGGGAAVVGAAARALSPDLRHRLPDAPAHSARLVVAVQPVFVLALVVADHRGADRIDHRARSRST